MTLVLRAARLDDAAAVSDLASQLGYASDTAAAHRRLQRLAGNPAARVLVAEVEGKVAAWLHVAEIHTLESDPYGEIVGLVVDAQSRSAGIGAALVVEAIAWAEARGLAEIRVRSNVVRERAHRFYERHGFAVIKSQKVFRRILAPR